MFKRFDKVFGFTFKNQIRTGSFRNLTVIMSLILFAAPVIIFSIVASNYKNDDEVLKNCGAEKIYIVNEVAPDADYSMLNFMGEENYSSITYVNSASADEAFATISSKGETKSLVLVVYSGEEGMNTRTYIPDGSVIQKDDASNLKDFLKKYNQVFTILALDLSVADLSELSVPQDSDVYSVDGYAEGISVYEADKEVLEERENEKMASGFNSVLVYITFMVVYFIVLAYGNSIMQNVVVEKTSKLMDTMLVSVSPSALVFGKMLGVLTAGFIQFFSWIISLVLGIFCGLKAAESINPDADIMVFNFLRSLGKMGMFSITDILIAVLVLIFGLVFYCSLSAIGGAISSTKEEAASNQSLFIILLVVSFYLVLMLGLDASTAPDWLYLFPGTAAMMLPAAVCTGVISNALAAAGLGIMVAATFVLLVLAGRIYTMMALYSGKKVNIVSALKMLFAKQGT